MCCPPAESTIPGPGGRQTSAVERHIDGPHRGASFRTGVRVPVKGSAVPATRVGFIGLGVMGYPMAGHLAAAGHDVTCFDIDPAMRDRMRDACPAAGAADDVAAVGAASDVVITMLPDGEQVRQVALDAGGLSSRWHPDRS